jgi:hypothetical protein
MKRILDYIPVATFIALALLGYSGKSEPIQNLFAISTLIPLGYLAGWNTGKLGSMAERHKLEAMTYCATFLAGFLAMQGAMVLAASWVLIYFLTIRLIHVLNAIDKAASMTYSTGCNHDENTVTIIQPTKH